MNIARKRDGDGGRLRAEGKLRRVERRQEDPSKEVGNRANPMVGSVLQHTRTSLEEETVEVVEPHEDGTRIGGGTPIPKENASRSPGVDSGTGLPTEGRSLSRQIGRCGGHDRRRS